MQPYYTKHVCSVSILIQGTTEMIIFLSGLAAPLFPGNRRKSGGHGAALVCARGAATYGLAAWYTEQGKSAFQEQRSTKRSTLICKKKLKVRIISKNIYFEGISFGRD